MYVTMIKKYFMETSLYPVLTWVTLFF